MKKIQLFVIESTLSVVIGETMEKTHDHSIKKHANNCISTLKAVEGLLITTMETHNHLLFNIPLANKVAIAGYLRHTHTHTLLEDPKETHNGYAISMWTAMIV